MTLNREEQLQRAVVPGIVRAQVAYKEATRRVEIARAARDGTVRGHERAQRQALKELLKAEIGLCGFSRRHSQT